MKKSNQRIHKKAEQKKPMEKDTAHNNLHWTIKKRANIKKKNKADDKKKVHRSVTHFARCRKENQNAAEGARFLQELQIIMPMEAVSRDEHAHLPF